MRPEAKAELMRWHVSSSDPFIYRSQRLTDCCPGNLRPRIYEVKRGDDVKAIAFTRDDADRICSVLATAAAEDA